MKGTLKKRRFEGIIIIASLCLTISFMIGYLIEINSRMEFSEDSLIFAAIGDPHYGWEDQYADEIVDAWMHDGNLPAVEFAVNIGDFTHFGSPEGYAVAMKDSFNKVLFPWMFIYGNHDTANYKTDTGRDIYGDGLGLPETEIYNKPYTAIETGNEVTGTMQRNYAYLWDNILFLIFADKGSTMLLTREQRQWLQFMTAQYPDKTTITMSHQGLYNDEEEGNTYRFYNDQEWWESFIHNNSQIALHIHGHNHKFKHYKSYGVDAIDVGRTNSEGKPWTVYFEITEGSIRAGIYDVLTRKWVNNNFFEKDISTSFKNEGISWYSITKRVQDKEKIKIDNRILAKNHSLQVIGSDPELIGQNNKFDYFGEQDFVTSRLYWIGYERDENNGDTKGRVFFQGKDDFAASIRPSLEPQLQIGWYNKWEEGKVPDSTTPIAISGEKYIIRMKAKASESIDNAMDMTIRVLGKDLTNEVYKKKILEGMDLSTSYQWFEGEFIVPNDDEAWIIQTEWESKQDNVNCYLDEWSITRDFQSQQLENFSIMINNHNYSSDDAFAYNEYKQFRLNNSDITNELEIESNLNGSKTALIRLKYEDPMIWSDDLSFGWDSSSENSFRCNIKIVSSVAPDDGLSISPFNSNGIKIADIPRINIKDEFYAWKLKKSDLPKIITVES